MLRMRTIRTLRNKPLFTATIVATLAFAIGGNTTMFTIIRAVLLKPLEYRESDRLVTVSGGATPVRFEEIRANAPCFASVMATSGVENVTFTGGGEPEMLKAARVSANFLDVLGVSPIAGRSFIAQEDDPGALPAAMISAELWERRFGRDPAVAGRTAAFSAKAYTIVGVLPPRFQFPLQGIDVWFSAPTESPLVPPKSRPISPILTLYARLKPGVSLEQANAQMRVVHRQYALAHAAMLDAKPKSQVELTPMKDALVAPIRSMLWLLFGAVGFVLLIACSNIASLLLTRAAARSREFAIRAALGAGRGQLMGGLLAESLTLSLIGGAAGVFVSVLLVGAIPQITSIEVPRVALIHVDWTVLGFAAALSLATGILFGFAPALAASRPDPIAVLRTAGAGAAHAPRSRLLRGVAGSKLLVVVQVALSLVLLIGAVLLMRTLANLRGADLGF